MTKLSAIKMMVAIALTGCFAMQTLAGGLAGRLAGEQANGQEGNLCVADSNGVTAEDFEVDTSQDPFEETDKVQTLRRQETQRQQQRYTLDGRRTTSTNRHTLYIYKGRKVIYTKYQPEQRNN